MVAMDSVEILSQWLAAINSHDVKALTGRQITSSWTRWVIGLWAQAPMEAGWRSYFQMCPDYRVRGDHVFAEGEIILVAGRRAGL